MRGKPMVKIKVLICLLLACGFARAGVVIILNMEDPIPVGREEIVRNIAPGWEQCVARASFDGAKSIWTASVECETNSGHIVRGACFASDITPVQEVQFGVAPNKGVGTVVRLICTR